MPIRNSLIMIAALTSAAAVASPTITFDAKAVNVAGVTPGAKVAWFSIARERHDWITNVVRRDGIDAADGKGDLAIPFDAELSLNSAWAAVDLATGDVAFGTPEGMRWVLVDAAAKAGVADAKGTVHLIEDRREFLELLLVRPGEGAWGAAVGDGGESDDDGEPDGVIRAGFADLRAVADSAAAPKGVRAGDVLVAIDPERIEAFSIRIGQPR